MRRKRENPERRGQSGHRHYLMARALSDYERLRQENIARNESFLKSLGLADIKCQMLPPKSKSRKRQMESESEGESEGESERGSATKKKQRRSRLGVEPSRKSARARGDPALLPDGSRVDPPTYANHMQIRRPRSGNYDSDLNLDIAVDDDATQRKRISAALLRQELDRKPEPDSIPKGRGGSKAAKKGKQAGAGVVPVSKAPATSTSTSSGSSIADVSVSPEVIQLTVTRISSMSNARLATRIKVIARASGSKCKEKLVAFYHALRLSGLTELAESCKNALEQLGHAV